MAFYPRSSNLVCQFFWVYYLICLIVSGRPEIFPRTGQSLFNSLYQKRATRQGVNYRGISLIDIEAEFFAPVMLNCSADVRDGRTRSSQSCFRRRRGYVNQICVEFWNSDISSSNLSQRDSSAFEQHLTWLTDSHSGMYFKETECQKSTLGCYRRTAREHRHASVSESRAKNMQFPLTPVFVKVAYCHQSYSTTL